MPPYFLSTCRCADFGRQWRYGGPPSPHLFCWQGGRQRHIRPPWRVCGRLARRGDVVGRMYRAQEGWGRCSTPCRASPALAQGLGRPLGVHPLPEVGRPPPFLHSRRRSSTLPPYFLSICRCADFGRQWRYGGPPSPHLFCWQGGRQRHIRPPWRVCGRLARRGHVVGRMYRAQEGWGRCSTPWRASPALAQGLGNRKMTVGRSPPFRGWEAPTIFTQP